MKRGGDAFQATTTLAEGSVVMLLDLMASPVKTPSRNAATHEAISIVQDAMNHLPEDYQRAVRLVYLEGQSVAAAAEEMDRTERAVHNLCYKAKLKLRDLLGSRSHYLSRSG